MTQLQTISPPQAHCRSRRTAWMVRCPWISMMKLMRLFVWRLYCQPFDCIMTLVLVGRAVWRTGIPAGRGHLDLKRYVFTGRVSQEQDLTTSTFKFKMFWLISMVFLFYNYSSIKKSGAGRDLGRSHLDRPPAQGRVISILCKCLAKIFLKWHEPLSCIITRHNA